MTTSFVSFCLCYNTRRRLALYNNQLLTYQITVKIVLFDFPSNAGRSHIGLVVVIFVHTSKDNRAIGWKSIQRYFAAAGMMMMMMMMMKLSMMLIFSLLLHTADACTYVIPHCRCVTKVPAHIVGCLGLIIIPKVF